MLENENGELNGVQTHKVIVYLVRQGGRNKHSLTAAFSSFPAMINNALHGFSELRLHELIHLQQHTMRFESTNKVLAKRALKRYEILQCNSC